MGSVDCCGLDTSLTRADANSLANLPELLDLTRARIEGFILTFKFGKKDFRKGLISACFRGEEFSEEYISIVLSLFSVLLEILIGDLRSLPAG